MPHKKITSYFTSSTKDTLEGEDSNLDYSISVFSHYKTMEAVPKKLIRHVENQLRSQFIRIHSMYFRHVGDLAFGINFTRFKTKTKDCFELELSILPAPDEEEKVDYRNLISCIWNHQEFKIQLDSKYLFDIVDSNGIMLWLNVFLHDRNYQISTSMRNLQDFKYNAPDIH